MTKDMSEQSNERELFEASYKAINETWNFHGYPTTSGPWLYEDKKVQGAWELWRIFRAPLLARIAELESKLEAAKLARIALVAFNAWHRDNDPNYGSSRLKDYYSNTMACFIATDKRPAVQQEATNDH